MKEHGKLGIKKCIIILIIIAIFVMTIFGISQMKMVKYTYANALLKNEKFEKALNIFESLKDYKDSETKKKEARIEYCKRNTGTMSGMISWKYNNFVGNRGDTGARIFAINLEIHEAKDALIDMNAEQGTNGIWISTADGNGNYKIDKMPCGNYAVFIVSNNTNGNYPEYDTLNSIISKREWLTMETINNKTFIRSIKHYENVLINANEEKTLSYDFGLTNW